MKVPWFFLILLTAVLVFISVKPLEGFDTSHNYVKPKTRDISYNITYSGNVSKASVEEPELFSPANVALFTLGFVLFIILLFLIIKLKS
jgi:hypothetical protein